MAAKHTVETIRTPFLTVSINFQFLCTSRTKPLQPDLLPMNHEALLQALNDWKRQIRQTLCLSAFLAGKMRMAPNAAAPIRKFKTPRTLAHKNLMYQARLAETLQHAVNSDLIEAILA
jgi:hypothetical protein